MARQVSINIDDQAVKVVYATRMGRKLKVVDTIILSPDKLDDFLKDEKEKDFTVSADFRKASSTRSTSRRSRKTSGNPSSTPN